MDLNLELTKVGSSPAETEFVDMPLLLLKLVWKWALSQPTVQSWRPVPGFNQVRARL